MTSDEDDRWRQWVKKLNDPDGDLLEQASREGTYKLVTFDTEVFEESPPAPPSTAPRKPSPARPKAQSDRGRPARRKHSTTKRVGVRLTPGELAVLEAARGDGYGEFIREAIIHYAKVLAEGSSPQQQRIERALEQYEAEALGEDT